MNIKLNTHFLDVKETYLFSDIAKRVKKFQAENPDREIIKGNGKQGYIPWLSAGIRI